MSVSRPFCKSLGCSYPVFENEDFCSYCARAQELKELNLLTAIAESIGGHSETLGQCCIDPHQPGAKIDQGKVRMHLITGGMARAITEVAKVATFGAAKYTDGGWTSVPDGFRRYEDAQQRHAAARHMNETHDQESQLPHLAHEAWNALAKLDLYLREKAVGT